MTRFLFILFCATACHAQLIGPGAAGTTGKSGNLTTAVTLSAGGNAGFTRFTNSPLGTWTDYLLTNDVESGSLMLVAVTYGDASQTVSVSDNVGDSFTFVVKTNSGTHMFAELWYAKNAIGGTAVRTTVHITGAGQYGRAGIWVASGCSQISPLDQFATGIQSAGNALTHDITTTSAKTIGVCVVGNFNGASATPQASWTEDFDSNEFAEFQHILYTVTGTYHGSAAMSGTPENVAVAGWFK